MILSNTHDFEHVAVMHGATMEHEPESFNVQEHRIEFDNQVHDPTSTARSCAGSGGRLSGGSPITGADLLSVVARDSSHV